MIHAKTLVADGWFSKVGSTNLNFSSLAANWEIDLVVEDTDFAKQMEQLFEDDISKSRGPPGRVKATPEVATRPPRGHYDAGRAPASSAAAQGREPPSRGRAHPHPEGRRPPADPRARHRRRGERSPARASLIGARFPRLVAWPLTAVAPFSGALASCARSNLHSPTAGRTARSRAQLSEGCRHETGRSNPGNRSRDCSTTEASMRLQVTDVLVSGPHDLREGRLTLEQWDVLQQIEAALEAYVSYFYPPETR